MTIPKELSGHSGTCKFLWPTFTTVWYSHSNYELCYDSAHGPLHVTESGEMNSNQQPCALALPTGQHSQQALIVLRVKFSGGFRGGGCKCTPLWWLVVYFCIHNCTSPSNGYAAVACSDNNQAQLHTRVSIPYWSPDVWLDLELLRDIRGT